MQMPDSLSTKKRRLLEGDWHAKKPDLTNLTKLLEDALKGWVFRDDNQVVAQTVHKVWTEDPYIDIWVCPLEGIADGWEAPHDFGIGS